MTDRYERMVDQAIAKPKMTLIKLIAYFILLVVVLNIAGILLGVLSGPFSLANTVVSQTGQTANGLVRAIINPEHALRSYRQVHGYYTAVKSKKGQIRLAAAAVARSPENRVSARLTELTGLQQGCINDVERYNELTRRTDTRIYTNPEEFLPDSWTGERQVLPDTLDQEVCFIKDGT